MRRPALLLAALVVPAGARAAGFYTTDAGVRAFGRGSAFTVGVDDVSAQYWNPAALVRVRREVGLQLTGVHQAVAFDRADVPGGAPDGGDVEYAPVHNETPPFPIPALAGAWGHGRVTAALGLYTPFAPTYAFPDDGPQRYALIDQQVLQVRAGPSVGVRVGSGLSVGAGLAWSLLEVDQSLAASVITGGFMPSEDPVYDVRADLSVRDPLEITWNAGVLWDPGGRFAAGACFTPPVTYEARGPLVVDFRGNVFYTGASEMGRIVSEPEVADEDVLLEVRMPPMVRVGGLVRPTEAWEVELDLAWEGWSTIRNLSLEEVTLDIPTRGDEPMVVDDDVPLSITLEDAVSVRLGAERRGPGHAVRTGLFFESAAVDADYAGVQLPDGPKVGWGLGATVDLAAGRAHLDAGLSQAYLLPRALEGSRVAQVRIDPLSTGDGVFGGTLVGDGTLAAVTTLVGLGLRWTP
ncbi:MAG: outer membrane protein transport protein [Deltaproteobacteria bacterium]|nr:outer membrane protein transport protein [Deltaproteobacteria bacterium]